MAVSDGSLAAIDNFIFRFFCWSFHYEACQNKLWHAWHFTNEYCEKAHLSSHCHNFTLTFKEYAVIKPFLLGRIAGSLRMSITKFQPHLVWPLKIRALWKSDLSIIPFKFKLSYNGNTLYHWIISYQCHGGQPQDVTHKGSAQSDVKYQRSHPIHTVSLFHFISMWS